MKTHELLSGIDLTRRLLARLKADLESMTGRALCAEAALAEIREEWAGAECGEPKYAQEAYAIALARRMYRIAACATDCGKQK